jgi:hypothetical protein
MRKLLAADKGTRKKFRGIFARFGKKTNFKGFSEMTVLLTHIVDIETTQVVADHVWFSYTKGFEDAKIIEGVSVEFEARIKEYTKGYVNPKAGIRNRKLDYKLSHPTRIRVLKE